MEVEVEVVFVSAITLAKMSIKSSFENLLSFKKDFKFSFESKLF